MNYHTPKRRSRLTSKCQVTIPKEVRDALGLKALDLVDFEFGTDGSARIVKVDAEADREQWLLRVKEVQRKFRLQDPLKEISNAEWFDAVRGPGPEV